MHYARARELEISAKFADLYCSIDKGKGKGKENSKLPQNRKVILSYITFSNYIIDIHVYVCVYTVYQLYHN